MKHFIQKILLFISIPLISLLLLEGGIYFFRENIFSEKKLERLFYKEISDYKWINKIKSDSINVLAGSSSVRYGLSCSKLSELNPDSSIYVNIAMDARDPIATYFIIKSLDLNKISAIYMGLDPWIYAKRYYKHRNSYLYLDFKFIELFKYSKEHDKSGFLKRYKNLLTIFTKGASTYINFSTHVPSDFGSVALNRTDISFNDSGDWFQIESYGWSDLQFTYLRKIQDYCETNNIKFTLFIPPKRSDYSKSYKNNFNEIHFDYVNKLDKTGINALIFGKFNQMDTIGDSLFFAEAYHLNVKGQIRYSEIFYNMTKLKNKRFTKDYKWFIE